MKNVLKFILIGCYGAAVVCAVVGVRSFFVHKSGGAFAVLAVAIPLPALVIQYVFLGFWNPVNLFKKAPVEIPHAEVTRAPWGN